MFFPIINADPGSIILTTTELDDSWVVTIALPPNANPGDRRNLIAWVQEYRSRIRSEHPSWVVATAVGEEEYSLRIFPVETSKQLGNAVRAVIDSWPSSRRYHA